MVALGIVLAHLVGDYLLQSHWMATCKTQRWWPAIAHGLTYTLPYLLVTQSPWALLVIASTHIVIDRYRLARHVVWLKNFLAPVRREVVAEWEHHGRAYEYHSFNTSWDDCKATGYPSATPPWLAVWLLIVADNTLHLLINAAAVYWL